MRWVWNHHCILRFFLSWTGPFSLASFHNGLLEEIVRSKHIYFYNFIIVYLQ